jgi:hypothetical protein
MLAKKVTALTAKIAAQVNRGLMRTTIRRESAAHGSSRGAKGEGPHRSIGRGRSGRRHGPVRVASVVIGAALLLAGCGSSTLSMSSSLNS